MGVDFVSYSNVIVKPIPEQYRAKKIKQEFNPSKLATIEEEFKPFYLMLNGIGFNNKTQQYVTPDKIEIGDIQTQYEEQLLENNDDFICLNFYNDKLYYKSEETNVISAGRSYSGYGDFIEVCGKILGRKLKYILPSTDCAPENGIATNEDNIKNLYDDLTIIKNYHIKKLDEEDHLWFFNEFYELVKNATNNGLIYIC
jgi:hypothetical protein